MDAKLAEKLRLERKWRERVYNLDLAKNYVNVRDLKRQLQDWQELDKGYLAQVCKQLLKDLEKVWGYGL